MKAIVWEEAPIAKAHDRAAFDCGDPDLNLYLQRFARQNHQIGGAKCFVAAPFGAPTGILGFYMLSPASIEYSRAPDLARKGLARYDAPVFRLGRLAVGRTAQGRGLGGALLLRVADRCIRVAHDVDGVAVLIDAKNDRAARWDESYGALRMEDAPLSLVLPLAVAADALKRGRWSGFWPDF
jgi:GNAT superfamily N-acetyltransferase